MSDFTEEETELLTDLVREYPVLYNLQHKNYFNNSIKENAWRLISETLQKPVGDCKTRWKTIRDSYRKQIKKVGSRSKYSNEKLQFLDDPSTHRLTKKSMFVEVTNVQEISENEDVKADVVKRENDYGTTRTNVDKSTTQNLVRERDLNSECTDTKTLVRKRTKHDDFAEETKKSRTQREQSIEIFLEKKHSDPLDIFFNGIAATVKRFPPRLIVEAKLAVAKLVSEFELRALCYPSSCSS